MLGLPICEDIWHPEVCRHLAEMGAEIFISPNGSPYEIDKDELRIDGVAKRRAIDTGLPLIYVNRVGGQDELVFDGASFVVGGEGALWAQLPDWEEAVVATRWNRVDGSGTRWRCEPGEVHELARPSRGHLLRDGRGAARLRRPQRLSRRGARPVGRDRQRDLRGDRRRRARPGTGLVRDAAEPLHQPDQPRRRRRVRAADRRAGTIPSRSSRRSTASTRCSPAASPTPRSTSPRRTCSRASAGVTLMALSNKFGPMLLTTGNKSEMSVGYATIYGDMAGGYNP